MLTVLANVAPSGIHGRGLFSMGNITAGTSVLLLNVGSTYHVKDSFSSDIGSSGMEFLDGVKWVGRLALVNSELSQAHFLNHSEVPNLLYHMGVFFAKRYIQAHEELTVDYRYLLFPEDEGFDDSLTGRHIKGYSDLESLRRSTLELVQILQKVAEPPPILLSKK